jgi:hypothetical protein
MSHPLNLHPLFRTLRSLADFRPTHPIFLAYLCEGAQSIKLAHDCHCIIPHVSVLVESQKHILQKGDETLSVGQLILSQLGRQ